MATNAQANTPATEKGDSVSAPSRNWSEAKFVQDVYIRMNDDDEKDYCFAVPIDGKFGKSRI